MGRKINYQPVKRISKFNKDLQTKLLEARTKVDKEEIIQVYSEFQAFMNWENAPEFDIDIFTQGDNNIARISLPTLKNPRFVLHIHNKTKELYKNNFKEVLFHEFTHIFDLSSPDSILMENRAKNIRSWYLEANAVTVSLMCLCGFKNIEEKKFVSLSNQIASSDKEITLEEYFLQKFNEIQECVNTNKYQNIIKPIQYYLGCWRFFTKCCIVSPDEFRRLSNLGYLIENFDINISKIFKIIREYNLSPEALQTMQYCNEEFKNMNYRKINEFKRIRK